MQYSINTSRKSKAYLSNFVLSIFISIHPVINKAFVIISMNFISFCILITKVYCYGPDIYSRYYALKVVGTPSDT